MLTSYCFIKQNANQPEGDPGTIWIPLCCDAEPYRDRVATTEVQNAWSSRDSRRLQIVPGSALAGNSNCKNRVTELRFLVISRQYMHLFYIFI